MTFFSSTAHFVHTTPQQVTSSQEADLATAEEGQTQTVGCDE